MLFISHAHEILPQPSIIVHVQHRFSQSLAFSYPIVTSNTAEQARLRNTIKDSDGRDRAHGQSSLHLLILELADNSHYLYAIYRCLRLRPLVAILNNHAADLGIVLADFFKFFAELERRLGASQSSLTLEMPLVAVPCYLNLGRCRFGKLALDLADA